MKTKKQPKPQIENLDGIFVEQLAEMVSELKFLQQNYLSNYLDGNEKPICDTISSMQDNIKKLKILTGTDNR